MSSHDKTRIINELGLSNDSAVLYMYKIFCVDTTLSYNPDRIAEQNATGRRRPGRPTCPDRVQPRHLLDLERPDQNFPE